MLLTESINKNNNPVAVQQKNKSPTVLFFFFFFYWPVMLVCKTQVWANRTAIINSGGALLTLTCYYRYKKTSGVITLRFSTNGSMAATTFSLAVFFFSCTDSTAVEMKKLSGIYSFNARWIELTLTPRYGGTFKIHLWLTSREKLGACVFTETRQRNIYIIMCSNCASV